MYMSAGFALFVFQLCLYARLDRRFGTKTMAITGLVVYGLLATLPPLFHDILVSGGSRAMWAAAIPFFMLRGAAGTSAFCSNNIMLQQSTGAHRGAVNGG
jgi:hypothetical protein